MPVVVYLALGMPDGGALLARGQHAEYVAFMALLGALFVITGGIYLRGELAGTPVVNTALPGGRRADGEPDRHHGRVAAADPAAAARQRAARAQASTSSSSSSSSSSNGAGLLTPLGDPPLFLGFLRGVPFFWTLRLIAAVGVRQRRPAGRLLRARPRRRCAAKSARVPRAQLDETGDGAEPLRIVGGLNFLWLLGVIAWCSCSARTARTLVGPTTCRRWCRSPAMLRIRRAVVQADARARSTRRTASAGRRSSRSRWSSSASS